MGDYVYIVNVEGSADDLAQNYGYDSWLDYWEEVSGREAPQFCCNNNVEDTNHNNEIVGAHVYICSQIFGSNNDIYSVGKKIFIAPLCRTCNGKEGYNSYNIVLSEDLMEIDEDYLVAHPTNEE